MCKLKVCKWRLVQEITKNSNIFTCKIRTTVVYILFRFTTSLFTHKSFSCNIKPWISTQAHKMLNIYHYVWSLKLHSQSGIIYFPLQAHFLVNQITNTHRFCSSLFRLPGPINILEFYHKYMAFLLFLLMAQIDGSNLIFILQI